MMHLSRYATKWLSKLRGRTSRRHRAGGMLTIVGLIVLVLYVLPAQWPQQAAASVESSVESAVAQQPPRPAFNPAMSGDGQIYNDDLIVAAGETFSGDVVVTSGDITVEEEGTVHGSLVTYSGDVKVDQGGRVDGDIASWSGDVTISGQVNGNVAVASGDVQLDETARVAGDVSVLSGELKRETGATIDGSVMMGPSFKFMAGPTFFSDLMSGHAAAPFAGPPVAPEAPAETPELENLNSASWGRRLGGFVLSLIGATVFAFVAMLLSGLMSTVWPQYVRKIETISRQQLPLSFALGLLANVSLLLVSLLLVVLVCTIPFALVLLLGMVAINIAGWAALSSAVGRRVTTQSQASIQPAVRVAVGALVLTAPLALLSAFGDCLRFVALLSVLLLSSAGAGAVVQDLLDQWSARNRRRRSSGQDGSGHGSSGQAGSGPGSSGGVNAPVDPAGGAGSATASAFQSTLFADVDPAADDFTRIQGIDEDADGRLLEAGIMTFAQLAALTPEALAEILGWPIERVIRENLIGRAEILAELS